MTDDHYRRADNGSVLRAATAAALLIAAGLSLMVWDNYLDRPGRDAALTVSALQRP